jgi:hypothetical protein
MHDTWPTLLPRVSAILRAKQYVVFFAIALYALDFTAPLASAWLRRGGSLADTLENVGSPFVDAGAGRSLAIGVLALAVTAVTAFFRAGYIRSIIGRFHPGPRDARQFWRLLGLQLVIEVVVVGTVLVGDWLPADSSGLDTASALSLSAAMLLLVFGSLVIAYADYAIVITGMSPWRAMVRSWRVFRLNTLVTVLVFVAVTALGALGSSAAAGLMTGLPQALPVAVIEVVLFGIVLFAADVVLIVVYLMTMESGRLEEPRDE